MLLPVASCEQCRLCEIQDAERRQAEARAKQQQRQKDLEAAQLEAQERRQLLEEQKLLKLAGMFLTLPHIPTAWPPMYKLPAWMAMWSSCCCVVVCLERHRTSSSGPICLLSTWLGWLRKGSIVVWANLCFI